MNDIVSSFKPPPSSPPPTGFLQEYFERDVETVLDFCKRHMGKSEDQLAAEIRTTLLSGLSKAHVGTYSRFHDNSAYHLGYDHSTTIRLAYMYGNSSLIISFLTSAQVHNMFGLWEIWPPC